MRTAAGVTLRIASPDRGQAPWRRKRRGERPPALPERVPVRRRSGPRRTDARVPAVGRLPAAVPKRDGKRGKKPLDRPRDHLRPQKHAARRNRRAPARRSAPYRICAVPGHARRSVPPPLRAASAGPAWSAIWRKHRKRDARCAVPRIRCRPSDPPERQQGPAA